MREKSAEKVGHFRFNYLYVVFSKGGSYYTMQMEKFSFEMYIVFLYTGT